MMISRRCFLGLSAGSMGAGFIGWRALGGQQMFGIEGEAAVYRKYRDGIKDLFEGKRPSGPGDWLEEHEEKGQSFDSYVVSKPPRATQGTKTIQIQPLGPFPKAQQPALSLLREYMGLLFGLPVRMGDELPLSLLPKDAMREHPQTGTKQLLSPHILFKILKPRVPEDVVAMLALTSTDLWPGMGWNFVFGQASLSDRVGVWSTARFGDPVGEKQLFLRRVLQVATHETGHIFGIHHCTAYECCMNGANSQDEGDRAPLLFCPECDAKLCWAANIGVRLRAVKLAAFMKKAGFTKEAGLWQRIAEKA